MRRKIVLAAVQCGSFAEAQRTLTELASLSLLTKRIWRATQRAGEEQLAEQQKRVQAYEALPLPARRQAPTNVLAPEIACVSMDGGRYQRRTRRPADSTPADERTTCWREMKVGCLTSMTGDVAAGDPCPQLPATFADADRMQQIAREIKGFCRDEQPDEQPDAAAGAEREDQTSGQQRERPGRPLVVARSIVATDRDVTAFGPLLAVAAYERGFHAAARKAFVADGSETNWGVWRKYFSHYTPILDFVHALMYVYAAAMAGGEANEGWSRYRRWSQWLWSGQTDALLADLAQRLEELGPDTDERCATPRAQVRESLGYLTNQRERMQYADYRRQGLPLTSTLVESTIKQINRRVKGTEKFWSEGIEPMLALIADQLSQIPQPTHTTPWQQAA